MMTQAIARALGSAAASASADKSDAYRIRIRLRLRNGWQTASEVVIGLAREENALSCAGLARRRHRCARKGALTAMWAELKELFATWIAAVAAAIEVLIARVAPRRRVRLQEAASGGFTASLPCGPRSAALQTDLVSSGAGTDRAAAIAAMAGRAARQPARDQPCGRTRCCSGRSTFRSRRRHSSTAWCARRSTA